METEKRLDHLEVNIAGLYDLMTGITQATTYLAEQVLTQEQRAILVEWLAGRASKSEAVDL